MPKIQKIKAKDFEKALYDMVFAYFNKDDDFPHSFEIEALKEAEQANQEVQEFMKNNEE